MKLLHLSDLHLGKRLNECSLLEDQAYILGEILRIAREEAPDAALLCGDLYDKAAPPAEAVALFDDFLVRLSALTQVFLLSGNHDSPERVAFGGRLMEKSGVHVAPVYAGHVEPVTLRDAWGDVNVYLLPFVKPAHVRRFFPETEIASWTDAVAAAVGEMHPDPAARSVLESTPPELASDVSQTGVLLTGGGSMLRGLPGYLAGQLHVNVALAPDPLNCVARGTAASLSLGRHLTAGFRDATPRVWRARL